MRPDLADGRPRLWIGVQTHAHQVERRPRQLLGAIGKNNLPRDGVLDGRERRGPIKRGTS
jgi:hypothetical protein